jgi:hypothetical protein
LDVSKERRFLVFKGQGDREDAKTGFMEIYGKHATSNRLVGRVNGPVRELWEQL